MIYIFDKELNVKETPDSDLVAMNSLTTGTERVNNVLAFKIVCRSNSEYGAFKLVAEHFLIKRNSELHFDESSNNLDYSEHSALIQKLKSQFPEYLI